MKKNDKQKKKEPDGIFYVYTDGACSGNPGPGGWASLILSSKDQKEPVTFSGYARHTTNNTMELKAAVEGLKKLPNKSKAVVISDSTYVVNGGNSWIHNWIRNGWKTTAQRSVANITLWKKLYEQTLRHLYVTFHWVRGHDNNEYNEICNTLAQEKAQFAKSKRT